MTRISICFFPIFFLAFVVSGCSNPAEKGRKNVSGTITLNGEAIKSGSIAIIPIEIQNPEEAGIIGGNSSFENGHYAFRKELGLFPGTYSVQITSTRYTDAKTGQEISALEYTENLDTSKAENIIPPQYRGGQSELTITVGEEKNQTFDFNLVGTADSVKK